MDEIKPGYTRISSILSQWDRFGHIDKAVLENKAAIGTRVHEAIDNHCKGLYIPLDSAAEGYFDSFLKWEKEIKPKISKNEERYYCDKMMITGQIDAVIHFPGDELPSLVDYKTSVAESPKTWPLQAGFYHYLAEENGLKLSDRMIFIRLDKYGDLPYIHEYKFTKELWRVCFSAWICYRHFQ